MTNEDPRLRPVWKLRGKSTETRLVLLRLAHLGDEEGRGTMPTVDELGRDCELSEAETGQVLADLKAEGLIEIDGRRYQLRLPDAPPCA